MGFNSGFKGLITDSNFIVDWIGNTITIYNAEWRPMRNRIPNTTFMNEFMEINLFVTRVIRVRSPSELLT